MHLAIDNENIEIIKMILNHEHFDIDADFEKNIITLGKKSQMYDNESIHFEKCKLLNYAVKTPKKKTKINVVKALLDNQSVISSINAISTEYDSANNETYAKTALHSAIEINDRQCQKLLQLHNGQVENLSEE